MNALQINFADRSNFFSYEADQPPIYRGMIY